MTYTGWTRSPCPDEEQLKAVGDQMSSAALAVGDVLLYHCDTLYGPGWNPLGSWNEIYIADSS